MIDGFILKKLLSVVVHLIPGTLVMLLLALLLRRWFPRASSFFAISLCCLLIAGSIAPVSNSMVSRLENRFPVLLEMPADTGLILVLGSGHMYEPGRPANSVLMATALSRLSEGVRLWKTSPDVFLALSGARFRSEISQAEAMKNMALQLGVAEDRILLFDQTRDTEEEVIAAQQALGDLPAQKQRLVVTSSASHLPRAALMLERMGVNYSMAPTDFVTVDAPWYRPDAYFLRNLDRAIHEWVGMLWYRLRTPLPLPTPASSAVSTTQ